MIKVKITPNGTLRILPQTPTEQFAIWEWWNRYNGTEKRTALQVGTVADFNEVQYELDVAVEEAENEN